MPAYHEATTPWCRALYERHGYVTLGEFTLPDGPPLWRMWRDPAERGRTPIDTSATTGNRQRLASTSKVGRKRVEIAWRCAG